MERRRGRASRRTCRESAPGPPIEERAVALPSIWGRIMAVVSSAMATIVRVSTPTSRQSRRSSRVAAAAAAGATRRAGADAICSGSAVPSRPVRWGSRAARPPGPAGGIRTGQPALRAGCGGVGCGRSRRSGSSILFFGCRRKSAASRAASSKLNFVSQSSGDAWSACLSSSSALLRPASCAIGIRFGNCIAREEPARTRNAATAPAGALPAFSSTAS